jgi:beta-N-acetylhexosaminidase
LIAVDEEGGTVTRVSRYPQFRESLFPSPRSLYEQGGLPLLLETEQEKCRLLRSLGINVNMAPVCDVTDDPWAFMYDRSLGLSPEETGAAIAAMVQVMTEEQVGSVLKHFPGYGNNTDTHTGIAVDDRPLEQLEAADLVPFAMGMEAGAGAVLVSHTFVNALDTELPASLSPAVNRYLREEMGFAGVIVTDDLVMQAITDLYGAEEAAVLAVLAGNDLLCSSEYVVQYNAVLQAVQEGRIPEEQLNAAAARVLQWKYDLGLLETDQLP